MVPRPVPPAAGARAAPRVRARVAPVPPPVAPSGARPRPAPPPGRAAAAAPRPRPSRDDGSGRRARGRAAPGRRGQPAGRARPRRRGGGLVRRARPQVVHVAGHLGRQLPSFLCSDDPCPRTQFLKTNGRKQNTSEVPKWAARAASGRERNGPPGLRNSGCGAVCCRPSRPATVPVPAPRGHRARLRSP